MLKEYIEEVRRLRGIVAKDTTDISDVFTYGSEKLVKYMLDTKTIGFRTASTFTQLPHKQQDELVVYMMEGHRVKDIKLKHLSLMVEEL